MAGIKEGSFFLCDNQRGEYGLAHVAGEGYYWLRITSRGQSQPTLSHNLEDRGGRVYESQMHAVECAEQTKGVAVFGNYAEFNSRKVVSLNPKAGRAKEAHAAAAAV